MSEECSNILTEIFQKVYSWSHTLTAESSFEVDYFWPEPIKKLLNRLKLLKGSLILLMGLQGTGKSEALRQLGWKLQEDDSDIRIVSFKWSAGRDQWVKLRNVLYDQLHHDYANFLYEKIRENLHNSRIVSNIKKELEHGLISDKITKGEWQEFKDKIMYEVEKLESIFPASMLPNILRQASIEILSNRCHTIFIDSRDYMRRDMRLMNTDLMGIQNLWNLMIEYQSQYADEIVMPNIVLAFQKELAYGSQGPLHFFIGKCEVIELDPITPSELVEAYKTKFKGYAPFTEEALTILARFSRGIWRRFKRYLSLTLDEALLQGVQEVDKKIVEQAVTGEELQKDWDLELTSIFRSEKTKAKAMQVVMKILKQPTLQKNIAKMFDNEMEASRIIARLEEYGFVKRERTAEGYLVKANI